jgi:hypothetical protein
MTGRTGGLDPVPENTRSAIALRAYPTVRESGSRSSLFGGTHVVSASRYPNSLPLRVAPKPPRESRCTMATARSRRKLVPELVPERFTNDRVSSKWLKFWVGVEGIEPSASTV